ncbi:SLAM family member 8 isoform X2 [Dermochelys coriacea]|uniref:SLAM family member 8 isoform X2 n=1 Tax=Dermochelys coriacea TaxID=27794 RepID=UPI001CA9F2D2|nr:SLAM family member 8 isoform X2 [Dermochelys coriacea]
MVAWLVLALLLHKAPPATARATLKVTGVVGRAVLLRADVPLGFQVRDAIWRYLAPAEELVATYFRGSAETLYQSRFYGRSQLHGNLTLEISQVELGDSGTFSALLVNTRGQTETRMLHLAVYEVISQLTLQVFTSEGSRSGSVRVCEVFLTCVAASGTNVTYSWGRTDGEVRKMLCTTIETSCSLLCPSLSWSWQWLSSGSFSLGSAQGSKEQNHCWTPQSLTRPLSRN